MATWRRRLCLAVCLLVAFAMSAAAQQRRATVRESRKVFRTYPYSDPNPVPVVGRIYPYFRFEGYTDQPIDREWTVVEPDTDVRRITTHPEIDGKTCSAMEKSTADQIFPPISGRMVTLR